MHFVFDIVRLLLQFMIIQTCNIIGKIIVCIKLSVDFCKLMSVLEILTGVMRIKCSYILTYKTSSYFFKNSSEVSLSIYIM